jgi:hypothetical protein
MAAFSAGSLRGRCGGRDVAELQISDIPAGPGGGRRVQVTWRDGSARRAAVAEFGNPPDDGDSERIRWYLEEYAEFPEDPAPALAAAAEARLAEWLIAELERQAG